MKGVYTALITPYDNNLNIDYNDLKKILKLQMENNIEGLVICGTTSEAPTFTIAEYRNIIKFVKKNTNNIKIIVGASSNSTGKVKELIEICEEEKVDGIMSVVPYYNRPTQEGIYAHFEKISQMTKLDILLYNIPSRTGSDMNVETIYKLSKISNIIGIKEATSDINKIANIYNTVNSSFKIFCGNDNLILQAMSVGASGIVSVISNAYPEKMKEIVDNFNNGEFKKSQKMFFKYFNLLTIGGIETNPIPIKFIMYKLKIISNFELRLPLLKLTNKNQIIVLEEMKKFGYQE